MTDLATTTPAAVAGIEHLERVARVAQMLADSDLVPQSYRGKPGNIVVASGLGASMGLSPIESLYRIDVIQGKPTASAELIASNVRRAGHHLQVDVQPGRATATITRGDDGAVYTVTRDMEWAKAMGLATKDNYKRQPDTMLQWRAITACARLACSEALYGVGYTAEEIEPVQSTARTAPDYTAPARALPTIQAATPAPAAETGEALTEATHDEVLHLLTEAYPADEEERAVHVMREIGRHVTGLRDLTETEGRKVLASLGGAA